MKKLIEMELMLAGWRETHNGGFIVQLLVQPGDDLFFRAHTAAKGKVAGQLYYTYWMPVTDDAEAKPVSAEKPTVLVSITQKDTNAIVGGAVVLPPITETAPVFAATKKDAAIIAEARKPHFPDGLTGLSVRWCADMHFQMWLQDNFPLEWAAAEGLATDFGNHAATDEAQSKGVILQMCGITSRKELNTNPAAAGHFDELIRLPYQAARKADDIDDSDPF